MYKGRPYSTGQTKWLFTVAAFALTIFASALSASTCTSGTVADYQAAGFACTIGDYTLGSFFFSATGDNLLDPSAIAIDPTIDSGGISVQFTGDFSVLEGQSAEYMFQYELDPLLPKITGTSVSTGPTDPATLTGQFCGNGT